MKMKELRILRHILQLSILAVPAYMNDARNNSIDLSQTTSIMDIMTTELSPTTAVTTPTAAAATSTTTAATTTTTTIIFGLDKPTFFMYLAYGLLALGGLSLMTSIFICCCTTLRRKKQTGIRKPSLHKASLYVMDPTVYEVMSDDVGSEGTSKKSSPRMKSKHAPRRWEVYELHHVGGVSKMNAIDDDVATNTKYIGSHDKIAGTSVQVDDHYDHTIRPEKHSSLPSNHHYFCTEELDLSRQNANTNYDIANFKDDGTLGCEYNVAGELKEPKLSNMNYDVLMPCVRDGGEMMPDINVQIPDTGARNVKVKSKEFRKSVPEVDTSSNDETYINDGCQMEDKKLKNDQRRRELRQTKSKIPNPIGPTPTTKRVSTCEPLDRLSGNEAVVMNELITPDNDKDVHSVQTQNNEIYENYCMSSP